jgi:hypothetical protein
VGFSSGGHLKPDGTGPRVLWLHLRWNWRDGRRDRDRAGIGLRKHVWSGRRLYGNSLWCDISGFCDAGRSDAGRAYASGPDSGVREGWMRLRRGSTICIRHFADLRCGYDPLVRLKLPIRQGCMICRKCLIGFDRKRCQRVLQFLRRGDCSGR